MVTTPEQVVAFNKANLDTAVGVASVALTGAELFLDLQLNTTKDVLAEAGKATEKFLAVKDVKDLQGFQPALDPSWQKAVAYSRSVYELAAQTQSKIAKLVEARVAELNGEFVAAVEKAAKSAPAGSDVAVAAVKSAVTAANTAYDNFSRVAKQVAELAEANVAAATEVAKGPSKKKAA